MSPPGSRPSLPHPRDKPPKFIAIPAHNKTQQSLSEAWRSLSPQTGVSAHSFHPLFDDRTNGTELEANGNNPLVPTKNDVVFGSGGSANKNRNGSLYQRLLGAHFQEYAALKQSQKEDFVFDNIIEKVEQEGGRFIQYVGNGEYELLDLQANKMVSKKIKQKIMQALRDKMKASKATNGHRNTNAHIALLIHIQGKIKRAEMQQSLLQKEQLFLKKKLLTIARIRRERK